MWVKNHITEGMALDGSGKDVNVFLPKLNICLGGIVRFWIFCPFSLLGGGSVTTLP